MLADRPSRCLRDVALLMGHVVAWSDGLPAMKCWPGMFRNPWPASPGIRPRCDCSSACRWLVIQSEGMHSRIEPLDDRGDDLIERRAVGWASEQRFAMIAPQDDVIAAAGNMETRRSRHPCPCRVRTAGRLTRRASLADPRIPVQIANSPSPVPYGSNR